jgi:hypothetical protein
MIGEILPAKSLILRQAAGTAKADGVTYELTTHAGTCQPIVCSSRTGKYFTLSWGDIIHLAQEAGIDQLKATTEEAA